MNSLKKKIGWTTLLSIAGFVLSFASQIIISYFFGTSAELDSYWVAFALMNLLAFPLASLKEALVPGVHQHGQSDPRKASAYFSQGMSLVLIVAAVGVIVAWLFGSSLSILMLGGTSSSAIEDLVMWQLHWLAPGILLLAISETLGALLTSFHKVIFQMVSRILAASTSLMCIGIFSGWIGINALSISFLFGQLVMSLVLVVVFLKMHIVFKPSWPRDLGQGFFYLCCTLLISALATQLYLLYEKAVFADFGTGIISSFQYGVSLTNVVIAILAGSLASVFWPRFMAYVQQDDLNSLYKEVALAIKISLIALGGVCSFAYLCASPIVSIIFVRGAFNQDAALKTAEMLQATIFTALPIAIITLLGRVLISLRSSKAIMFVGLSIAISGAITLKLAYQIESINLAIHHWLVANIIGCIVSALVFGRVIKLHFSNYLSDFWWIGRFIISLTFMMILWGFLGESIYIESLGLIGLFLMALAYGFLYLLIAWGARLLPPLKIGILKIK
ncbi:lipid II flippase MurJ [Polynucleobacter alcilacus]|uniref:lipid II flippase MurJ n=1 Tax=Polynucleobacter alcilacus TaxID=1819739 RepID=UPI001C0B305E|nr:lipid II flippase MurJ [Polynucleobacter alcilacus]MBU3568160.1 hypothetical protein [Polynucleobacter alcilacus]